MRFTFDAPSREECTAERVRSNTPLQALVLLNDPSFVEAASALAGGMIESSDAPDERLRVGFERVLCRAPRPNERDVLLELARAPGTELEAWTSVARVLLNLHETITRN